MLNTSPGSQATGQAKGKLARVNIVVAPIVQSSLNINHWVAGDHTALKRFLNTLLYSWAILLRHYTTLNFVDELKALTWLVGLKAYPDVTVLATTTRLLSVLTLHLSSTTNRLAEGNLRLTDVSLNVKLTLHAVDQNIQVELTHTTHNSLAGFLVGVNAEGWVFFCQALQGNTHLLLVGLCLWLYRD